MGRRDVLLLDKAELTSGSTWHAAGLVGQLRSHRNLTRMLTYSVELYEMLGDETDLCTGGKQSGCLYLASTADRMCELKKAASTARTFGLEMHSISPREALDLFPLLVIDDLAGAAFMPTDGEADPAGIAMALIKGTRNRGCKVREHTLVTGFQREGRSIAFAYLPVEQASRIGGFEIEVYRELHPVPLRPQRQFVDPGREKLPARAR